MYNTAFVIAIRRRMRQNRSVLLATLMSRIASPNHPTRILDVGGTWKFWREVGLEPLGASEVTLLNVYGQADVPHPFTAVIGDARDLSRFDNREFDVVFSNSVIGHVGTLQDQSRMAQEIRRVGKQYFIQTPNQNFPIDWRTLVPFFHFLPESYQAFCFRHFRVGTYPRIPDFAQSISAAGAIRNLNYRELRQLFPGATIFREKMCGFTKSFVVHSTFDGLDENASARVASHKTFGSTRTRDSSR